MRIALLHPPSSTDVASESGLFVQRLGRALVRRGNDVVVLSSDRANRWAPREDGVTAVHCRSLPTFMAQRFYEDHLERIPGVVWRLLRGSFDVAHAFVPADAWAGVQAKRFGGPPVVFSFQGTPTREWLVARHYRLEMMLTVAAAASECLVQDADTAELFKRHLLEDARVLPSGIVGEDMVAVYEAAIGGAPKRARSRRSP